MSTLVYACVNKQMISYIVRSGCFTDDELLARTGSRFEGGIGYADQHYKGCLMIFEYGVRYCEQVTLHCFFVLLHLIAPRNSSKIRVSFNLNIGLYLPGTFSSPCVNPLTTAFSQNIPDAHGFPLPFAFPIFSTRIGGANTCDICSEYKFGGDSVSGVSLSDMGVLLPDLGAFEYIATEP
jgi:hypothetical protein